MKNDEIALFHSKPDEISILSPAALFNCIQIYKIEPCDYIKVSTRNGSSNVAYITKHNDSNEQKRAGRLIVCQYPHLNLPIQDQSFERAHEINIEWSQSSMICVISDDNMLVQTCDFIDETGRSYYGKSELYLYDMKGRQVVNVLTYAGPIHSYSWFPKGGKFIVQSGFMPGHTVVYGSDGNPILQMGVHHRNTLRWSPLNRFLLIGGFENLKGEMDIWDMMEMKQVGSCTSHHASLVEWAPDGRHFLTAIVEQTLRVSNEVNVTYGHPDI